MSCSIEAAMRVTAPETDYSGRCGGYQVCEFGLVFNRHMLKNEVEQSRRKD